jgi:hypothetical protein
MRVASASRPTLLAYSAARYRSAGVAPAGKLRAPPPQQLSASAPQRLSASAPQRLSASAPQRERARAAARDSPLEQRGSRLVGALHVPRKRVCIHCVPQRLRSAPHAVGLRTKRPPSRAGGGGSGRRLCAPAPGAARAQGAAGRGRRARSTCSCTSGGNAPSSVGAIIPPSCASLAAIGPISSASACGSPAARHGQARGRRPVAGAARCRSRREAG